MDQELGRCLRQTKIGIDELLTALTRPDPGSWPDRAALTARVLATRELLAGVAVRRGVDRGVQQRLRTLAAMEALLDGARDLDARIAAEAEADRAMRAEVLAQVIPDLRRRMAPAWGRALGLDAPTPDPMEDLDDRIYAVAGARGLRQRELLAIVRVAAPLRRLTAGLDDLSAAVAGDAAGPARVDRVQR